MYKNEICPVQCINIQPVIRHGEDGTMMIDDY